MGFNEAIKEFAERALELKTGIQTEETTKMSLIIPFFQLLGYNVFDHREFCPEYVADVGTKKGEKVDYAILIDDKPVILIECKWCEEPLDKHGSQLYRYFSTTSAKFGILTNGLVYRFFTDLEQSNIMDLTPFLEIDLLNLKESLIPELRKFSKEAFDPDSIFSTASELKYTSQIKERLSAEVENPSDDFIRFIISEIYDGKKNQKAIEKFRPIVKKSFTSFVNEIVNAKIAAALKVDSEADNEQLPIEPHVPAEPESKIITTEEEIEAYYIIRGLLVGVVSLDKIFHRDTESYFGILYNDNNRKPICRLKLQTANKQLMIPDENKNFTKYHIENPEDVYQYKDQLIEVVKRYL